jgi:hypothetical protein
MKKLSELIREGAKLRPQAQHSFFDWVGGEFCSCAFGAAYEAATGKNRTSVNMVKALNQETGLQIMRDTVIDPGDNAPRAIFTVVTRMNDEYGKSREEIADYLESKGF